MRERQTISRTKEKEETKKNMDLTASQYFVAIILMTIAIFDGHCKSYSNSVTNGLLALATGSNGMSKDKNKTADAAMIVAKEPKFFDEFECK